MDSTVSPLMHYEYASLVNMTLAALKKNPGLSATDIYVAGSKNNPFVKAHRPVTVMKMIVHVMDWYLEKATRSLRELEKSLWFELEQEKAQKTVTEEFNVYQRELTFDVDPHREGTSGQHELTDHANPDN